ncbi:MAG: hypothetical protein RMN24_12990 [Anaerolineae bacterium]|nr:hypothetical protein [Anaerolineae bacterium]
MNHLIEIEIAEKDRFYGRFRRNGIGKKNARKRHHTGLWQRVGDIKNRTKDEETSVVWVSVFRLSNRMARREKGASSRTSAGGVTS